MNAVPSLDHLRKAYAVTSQATQLTPLLEARALARETGAARVFVKAESLQWAGSFKVRGAYWRLKQLSPEEAARGVVAYSSGNFAQGLAAAGEALNIPVTIVMPIDAPEAKKRGAQSYGATVISTDHGDRRARKWRRSAPGRFRRNKAWRCCIRLMIRRSSRDRPARGWRRSGSSTTRMLRPT